MATDRNFLFENDLQNLDGDAIIELFVIDLFSGVKEIPKNYVPDANTDSSIANPGYFFFCNWQETNGASVQFAGNAYVPLPYTSNGFAISNEGVLPNPELTISNVGLEPTSLINSFDDLLGARVIRRRVLAKHLDLGSAPDVNSRWPDETWFVQRKVAESKLLVTFELSTPFDLDGVTLPKRRALRYACPWVYRSSECGYTGAPVADVKDVATSDPAKDKCGKRVTSCRLRYDGSKDLPYGGFPGLTLE